MNPLHVRAHNYRTWDDLDVAIPMGCTAVLGENGAGKSSIVNIVDLALFGPTSRSLADYLSKDAGEDEQLLVELEFEHSGTLYRVRRTYSARGRGTTKVDLERFAVRVEIDGRTVDLNANHPGIAHEGDWHPLTRETAAATQQLISDTIGLSRETFRASVFLAQGDGAAFTEAAPRDRKRILCEALGLDVWDLLLERVRVDRHAVETDLTKALGAIETAEHDLLDRKDVVAQRDLAETARAEANAKLEDLDAALDAATGRLARAREAQAALAAAQTTLQAHTDALNSTCDRMIRLQGEESLLKDALAQRDQLAARALLVDDLEAQRAELAGEISRYEQARAKRAGLEGKLEQLRVAVDENTMRRERSTAAVEQLRARVRALDDDEHDAPSCAACGQSLADPAARARARATVSIELTEAQQASAKLVEEALRILQEQERLNGELAEPMLIPEGDLTAIERALAGARDAQVKSAGLEAKQDRLDAVVEEIASVAAGMPDLEKAVEAAATEIARLSEGLPIGGIDQAEAAVTGARARVDGQRDVVKNAELTVARCDERLARFAEIAASLMIWQEKRAVAQREIDVLALLEKAYGKSGIPALIIENAAIPQIEMEASRILAELGTSYRVELRTQRALKDGDGLRDTLDVVVIDGAHERPYETYSEGEKTRLNVALRIALARLLAHRRGAESRALIIDEPEYLDESGTTALARVLHELGADFDRVLLISHVPALREAFEQVLLVEKDVDGRSRIVGAPVAVAA